MRALIVPIDNRPVTFQFPQIVACVAGVEVVAPPWEFMGSLASDTKLDALNEWIEQSIKQHEFDALLICLDSVIHGGLIRSRRSDDSLAQLTDRAKLILNWKKISRRPLKVLAQSSIMRISDNNDNTEEKEYWSQYGRQIFAWSELMHRLMKGGVAAAPGSPQPACLPPRNGGGLLALRQEELSLAESRLPENVRSDYLATRMRNFQINQKLLWYAGSGTLDFLVFSQDDSGQFGLNVYEKERLQAEASLKQLDNVMVYPGADEVLLTLMARWLNMASKTPPRAVLHYSALEGASIASRYEGQTIGQTVIAQMGAAGIEVTTDESKADFVVLVHTAPDQQGDQICLPGHADASNLQTGETVQAALDILKQAGKPCVVCDVAYANGADPMLAEALLSSPQLLRNISSYAGWNTTGNTIGSALALAVANWFSGGSNSQALKQALFIRFADDWAYQTQVRKQLSGATEPEQLHRLMDPYLARISRALDIDLPSVNLSQPWHRTFEISVSP
jgi:hypothetical protein